MIKMKNIQITTQTCLKLIQYSIFSCVMLLRLDTPIVEIVLSKYVSSLPLLQVDPQTTYFKTQKALDIQRLHASLICRLCNKLGSMQVVRRAIQKSFAQILKRVVYAKQSRCTHQFSRFNFVNFWKNFEIDECATFTGWQNCSSFHVYGQLNVFAQDTKATCVGVFASSVLGVNSMSTKLKKVLRNKTIAEKITTTTLGLRRLMIVDQM